MGHNKIDFINELLASEKISVSDKSRILELTRSELKNFDQDTNELRKRIESIEDKLKVTETVKQPVKSKKSKLKIHSPKTMVKFLYQFSIAEKFKWFTHNPEGLLHTFDYHSYLNNANKEFYKLAGGPVNVRTYYHVKNFTVETDVKSVTYYYGRNPITFTWKDVRIWCERNKDTHPYRAEINGELFKKYIDQFKQTIEFRTDDADLTFNVQLRQLIRQVLGPDFFPLYTQSFNEIGKSMRIYCDINLFKAGLQQILEWILLFKSRSNEVEVNLINHPEYYQLEITHKNSYISSSPSDDKWQGLSGDFDKTRQVLFGVADWSINATFQFEGRVEHYKMTCLDSNTTLDDNKTLSTISKEIMEVDVINVMHFFRLYKTKNL